MDQATQQNAALVEQMAAAASSLKNQAGEMVQTVAIFKVESNQGAVRQTARSVAPVNTQFKGDARRLPTKPVKPSASKPPMDKQMALPKPVEAAKSQTDRGDEWETF
jgi:methyl-accepting chemotaxis protein